MIMKKDKDKLTNFNQIRIEIEDKYKYLNFIMKNDVLILLNAQVALICKISN